MIRLIVAKVQNDEGKHFKTDSAEYFQKKLPKFFIFYDKLTSAYLGFLYMVFYSVGRWVSFALSWQ